MIRSNLRAFAVPLLLFFTLFTVTAPARAALFLVPPVVALVGSAGTAATINAGATAAVLVVGALMSAVVLNGMSSTASQKILTGSKVPTPTPAGYTAPTSPSLEPNPPVNVSQVPLWQTAQVGALPIYATADGACSAWKPYATYVYSGTVQITAPYGKCIGTDTYDGSSTYWWVSSVQTCPAGYSIVSSSCSLSNPALVALPVEVQPTARPTPGTSPAILPVPGSKPLPTPGFTSPGVQQGINENNAPMNISVNPLPLPNGQTGSQTKYTSEVIDPATGTTMTKTTAIKTDENGVVTEITVSVLPQSMSGTQTSGGTSAPITFPTDYNREVTQVSIKTDAKTYQDAVKADRDAAAVTAATIATTLRVGGAPPPLPPPTDVTGYGFPTKSLFPALSLGLSDKIPAGTACAGIPVTLLGQSTALDPCAVVSAVKPMVNWMIIILGAISGLFVFLKPDEAI